MKTRLSHDEQRKRDLAQIHIAKTQLGLDDDTYREILWQIGKVRSSRDLSTTDRLRVLQHFKDKGWRAQLPRTARRGTPKATSADKAPLISKIGALLAEMKLPWVYANRIAQQMFKAERVDWCTPQQLHKIVAALTYRAEKAKKNA